MALLPVHHSITIVMLPDSVVITGSKTHVFNYHAHTILPE